MQNEEQKPEGSGYRKAVLITLGIIFLFYGFLFAVRLDLISLARSFRYGPKFQKLVKQSADTKTVDLREFFLNDWDELALWKPTEELCDLGLEDAKKDTPKCAINTEAGFVFLFFTKENRIVTGIRVMRSELDITNLPKRLPRQMALFHVETLPSGEFPKVASLVDESSPP